MGHLFANCTEAGLPSHERERVRQKADALRADPTFARWAAGYGVIRHDDLTQLRVHAMLEAIVGDADLPDVATGLVRLAAADRIASAGLWLVAHMTYARRVHLDGRPLEAEDFKSHPEGHTGGSLNMAIAYAAYLAMNALDGRTRSWMMGQGHCVAAIDALNLIVGNMTPAHAERYGLDDPRLSRFVSDFYSFAMTPDGRPASPLGSHVNAHTAGGTQEGGYLGFTELQYVHAPLPGERLVTFLSDGAFEEQRGSDWAPRWWRPQDCGLVCPVMILNGRRIEQRTQIDQLGGEPWLHHHLRINGFEPLGLDGRDPASIAWGIHAMEQHQLDAVARAGDGRYDTREPLQYGIAETVKGYGFPGAGSNRAHNLPLPANPRDDDASRMLFNDAIAQLRVPPAELFDAVAALSTHERQRRPRERDHPLACRDVRLQRDPDIAWEPATGTASPMAAIDRQFCAIVNANPHLRPRVGNPDELRSNKLDATLDLLKHRVLDAEPGIAESPTGAVITALNEEAVVCAALGNKGGINLVVTYEAFAPKMLGALRQEITFSRQLAEAGRPPGWLSVPVLLTSQTWENAKNEISHQDPTLAEALLGEMADTSVVVFPPDANAAMAALAQAYATRGRIVAMVVPKREVPRVLTPEQALRLARDGAVCLGGDPARSAIVVTATGAYQLCAARQACERLAQRGIANALVYLAEPGRLRTPRDPLEAAHVADQAFIDALYPAGVPRVFIAHARPEPYLGALRRVDTGPRTTRALGYINRGGTLDVDGMLFANRCSGLHAVAAAADVLGMPLRDVLSGDEIATIEGRGDPALARTLGR
ncbi:xylulose 5-phosphate 3-epimerase [Lysobacter arvi]|uniref:Xylulose 5-phosphate 3-epimerase n=1 Tax=Lysobacter arvi TaxID=3038776 RepID=A0ABU1CB48_9GAMM|nr:xylulose 5-phosphate 3-epimerase [Lysobacter arvi]MDR0181967.1 xylulose 5-phosphate 3-epimerase [Lysobacter arvi]